MILTLFPRQTVTGKLSSGLCAASGQAAVLPRIFQLVDIAYTELKDIQSWPIPSHPPPLYLLEVLASTITINDNYTYPNPDGTEKVYLQIMSEVTLELMLG